MSAKEKLEHFLNSNRQDKAVLSVFAKLASNGRIGETLLRSGIATKEQLISALYSQSKESGKKIRIGDILVKRRVVSVANLESLA